MAGWPAGEAVRRELVLQGCRLRVFCLLRACHLPGDLAAAAARLTVTSLPMAVSLLPVAAVLEAADVVIVMVLADIIEFCQQTCDVCWGEIFQSCRNPYHFK